MKKFKNPLLFVLVLLPIAIVGGLFTTIYAYNAYSADTQKLMLEQLGSYEALIAVGAVQSALYATVCGFFGYILAEKTGLMKSFRFEKKAFVRAFTATVVCGLLFTCDYFTFGKLIPQVAESYEVGISPALFFSSLTYGGIIEEVLLRLFFMTLLVFVLWKLFARGCTKENIPVWVLVTANILAALVFAAGHIPTTINMFGELNFMILFRCFLLNGGLGIVFGRLYRKYGIQYAMMGHLGCHLISKLILIAVL